VTAIATTVDTASKEFRANQAAMQALVAELEARRRHHFLLQHLDLPDFPPDQRHLLGAHAITRAGQTGPVKRLLKKLRSKLAAQTSPLQADALLTKLKNDARDLASQPPPNKNNH